MLCSEPMQRRRPSAASTKGGGLRPPPFVVSFILALNKAHVLALNTAHVLRLNKADVLALSKAHVLRLNNKICPVISVENSVISVSCKSLVSKTRSSRSAEVIVKTMRLAPTGKNTKSVFQNICVFLSKVVCAVLAPARERRDPHQVRSLRTTRKCRGRSRALKSCV